ncbi:uncharacterized protein LOC144098926 [Amblyomma americanum]
MASLSPARLFSSPASTSKTSPVRLFSKVKSPKFSKDCKAVIVNVYASIRKLHSEKTVRDVLAIVGEMTGVSPRTVVSFKKEGLSGGVKSPQKRPKRMAISSSRSVKYDSFTVNAIRLKLHRMYAERQIPTLDSILHEVNGDDDLPDMSKATLWRLLKEMGFKFEKRKRTLALIERSDIVAWRRRYLRAIKAFRSQGRCIVYLDETWVNAGHTRQHVWKDSTVKSSQDAFLRGLTTGLPAPSGKGGRLILVHAGSSLTGFVSGAADFFRAKKGASADYHSEMDGKYFEEWFSSKLLPNIPNSSIIVMDNAPYHSVALEKPLTTSTRKIEIQAWLTRKGIFWSTDMVRAELLDLCKRTTSGHTVYAIDTLAAKHGHEVLRLPPYHCEFNPIEQVWSMVKGFVAKRNKAFTLAEVEELLPQALAHVSKEDWQKFCAHAERIEDEAWERDIICDDEVDPVVFAIGSSSSSSEESSSELSGIEELE